MSIETRKETLPCIECGKKHEIVVMTDTSDQNKPELFKAPAGAFLTQCMFDDDSDDMSWVLMCSDECATTFLATFDDEGEDDEDDELGNGEP